MRTMSLNLDSLQGVVLTTDCLPTWVTTMSLQRGNIIIQTMSNLFLLLIPYLPKCALSKDPRPAVWHRPQLHMWNRNFPALRQTAYVTVGTGQSHALQTNGIWANKICRILHFSVTSLDWPSILNLCDIKSQHGKPYWDTLILICWAQYCWCLAF